MGRTLFAKSVSTLRKMSVRSNDLPQRLAEVMAQFWHASGASEPQLYNNGDDAILPADDTLQLKVRCRSSLSVLFDAIWRWRQQVGQDGRESLAQAVEHPTSVQTDTHRTNTPNPAAGDNNVLSSLEPTLAADIDPLAWDGSYGSNAVFDPLSWALDGNLNFPAFGGTDGLGF